jgi:hypothetical protein
VFLKITITIHSAGTAAAECGIAVRVFSLLSSFDRGAGVETPWPQFLAVGVTGLLLYVFSLTLFRHSIAVSR